MTTWSVQSGLGARARAVYAPVLDHMIRRVNAATAETAPFSHAYFEDVLPPLVYEALLDSLPDAALYARAADRHYRGESGSHVRLRFALSRDGVGDLPSYARDLWRGVAAALTDPALKRAVFAKLAPDLAYRYGVPEDQVPDLAGHARPVLYRETEGFEIPPHPDTRKKVVTMHLYLPGDLSQIGLGTALYKPRPTAWPLGHWRRRFERVKQFAFRPNSGYAFVVNNTLRKRSWHGRDRLPEGSGVRNTLLNTFYAEAREEYLHYLPESAADRGGV